MKQKNIMITAAVLLAAAAILAGTAGKDIDIKNQKQKSMDLGNEYLNALEYEQAIAYYKQVLEIDPADKEALVNISAAYAGMNDTMDAEFETVLAGYDMALEYAKRAYTYYPTEADVQENLLQLYLLTGDRCKENQAYEKALDYYQEALNIELDESLSERREEGKQRIDEVHALLEEAARNAEYEALLKAVLEAWEKGDMEEVKGLIRQDSYNYMAFTLVEGESYYYGGYDDAGNRSGIGAAVYWIYDEYYIPFYYLGEWKNGMREGQADWLYSIDELDGAVYQCEWAKDFPEGAYTCERDYRLSEIEEGTGVCIYEEGNVSDGLFVNVTVTYMAWDGATKSDTYTYTNGYVDVIRIDTELPEYPYIISETIGENGKLEGTISCSEEYKNALHGMPGFGESRHGRRDYGG